MTGDVPIRGAETTHQLIARARTGDREAEEQLCARYLTVLQRWAAGRLPHWARGAVDTQDLVQDVLIQTLKRLETFEVRRDGALTAYLRQAVMNRIRDEIRRRDRRGAPEPLDLELPAGDPSPLEAAIGQQTLVRYEHALARLRPDDREAIVGRVEMGWTYDELAVVLGKSTREAARKATERALLRLAAEMKHDRSRGSAAD